ncbi:MAG: alcohol dehydrogenase catalytic domain-containing protein [Terracidiphilus sp.]|jgi:propanol-preferring alcohol dehydrogenase
MKAARLNGFDEALSIEELPIPKPGPREVVVAVEACGVCGSDLTIIHGGLKTTLPRTLGHEIAGTVAEVGAGCKSATVGMRVVVYIALGCGDCKPCSAGEVFCCIRGAQRIGVTQDGGFAEYVLVPETNIIPLPASLAFEAGAVLTDAVATCLHALEDVGKLVPGEVVAIFGIGGLATSAIQIAKMHGCRVLAVSRSTEKLELALSLGADEGIVGGEMADVVRAIHAKTNGLGADVALQLVANPDVDLQSIASLATFGRAILVGFTTKPFVSDSLSIVLKQLTITGSRGMTRENIRRAIHLAETGTICLDPLLQAQRPLFEINEVIDDFRAGKILRAIIKPAETERI